MDLDHQPHTVSVQSGPGQPTPQPAPSSSAPVTPAASAATSSTTPAASSAGTDAEIKGRFKVKHITTDTVLAGTAIKAQVVLVGTPTAQTPSAQIQYPVSASTQGGAVSSVPIPIHVPTAPPGLIRIPSSEVTEGGLLPISETADVPDAVAKVPKKSRFTVKTISKEDDRYESTQNAQDRVTPTLPASGSTTPAVNVSSGNTPLASSSGAHSNRTGPVQTQGQHSHHHHAYHHHGAAPSTHLVTGAVAHASILLTPAKTPPMPASMHSQGHSHTSHQKAQSVRDDQIERMMQILETNNKILLTLSGQINVEDHAKDTTNSGAMHHGAGTSHYTSHSNPPPPPHQHHHTVSGLPASQHQVQPEKDGMEPPGLSRSLSMNTGLFALASGAPSTALVTAATSTSHAGVSSLVPFTPPSATTTTATTTTTTTANASLAPAPATGTAAADHSFARFAHHLTEMKKELEIFGKNKRETATEIQRLREKCQQLEDRASAEHSRCLTLEDRLEKSAQKNRQLLNQIEALNAILASHNISLDGSIIPIGPSTATSSGGVVTAVPLQTAAADSSSSTLTSNASTIASASAPAPSAAAGAAVAPGVAITTPYASTAQPSLAMPTAAGLTQAIPQPVVTGTTTVRTPQAPMVPGKIIDTNLAPINSTIGGFAGLHKPIGLQHSSSSTTTTSSFIPSASTAVAALQPPISSTPLPLISHQSIFHPISSSSPVTASSSSAHLSAPVSNPMLAAANPGMVKHTSSSMGYTNMATSVSIAAPPSAPNSTMSSSTVINGNPTTSSIPASGGARLTGPLLRAPQGISDNPSSNAVAKKRERHEYGRPCVEYPDSKAIVRIRWTS